jgi:hypothetical protein
MQRSIRILCTGALAAGLTLATGVGAHGALVDFSAPPSAVAGSTITVSSIASCTPDAEVLVAISATGSSQPPLASATTTSDGSGNWSVQLTIPVTLAPGVYDLQAFCSNTPNNTSATAIDPPFQGLQYDLSSIEITAAAQTPVAEEVTAAPRTAG